MNIKKALSAIAVSAFVAGCSTVTPESLGVATGTAAYLAYAHVAEDKDQAFKDNVAALWRAINAIDNVDELIVNLHELDSKFDDILAYDKLSSADKQALQSVRDMVLRSVYDKAAGKLDDSEAALQYLAGVRRGVNSMLVIYGASNGK